MKKIKNIHFVGIKGVGMTGLAVIAKKAGLSVTGSDVSESFITDEVLRENGIVPMTGFLPSHLEGGNTDLVVTTGAHDGLKNIEVLEARKKKIKVITHGEAVGLFMDGTIFNRKFTGVSVCGTNGKTTTTAMLATILKMAKLNPSYLVGTSTVKSLGFASDLGQGNIFVAEADEYATDPVDDLTPKFLWQNPKIIILINISFDHPDVYKSIKEIKVAFKKFISKLAKDGSLVVFGDDPNIKDMVRNFNKKVIRCGFDNSNDYVLSDVVTQNGKTNFNLSNKNNFQEKFRLGVFGKQNAIDASLAIIAARELKVNINELKKGVALYQGSKRRSEYIGKLQTGAFLYDDYAHNPEKISATLKSFKEAFPKKKIICIFQPHTYSRTKYLFEQFSRSFDKADEIVLTSIYSSLREKPDPSVSMHDLTRKIKARRKKVLFFRNMNDVIEYVNMKNFDDDYVILTMGAGDIYKISSELRAKN
jgi:UDP-N-acetylmuramate--alanine ligase